MISPSRRAYPRTKALWRSGIPMILRADVWLAAIGNTLGVRLVGSSPCSSLEWQHI